MKNNVKIFTFLFCSFLAASVGCKKTNNSITGGGIGGSSVLTVTAEHANSFIDSCKFYIKYGTNDAPASGIYDDSIACVPTSSTDTTPIAVFKNLTRGQYYLYGRGYHVGYTPPFVAGGEPCTITSNNDTQHVYVPTYTYNN